MVSLVSEHIISGKFGDQAFGLRDVVDRARCEDEP
jgi:hypothetical protein